jgi:ribosomal protein S18 acetylase RimI-like enzyme
MAIPDQLTYQMLVSADDPSFEDFFRIYAEAIHPREQKSKALISKMVSRSDYKILVQIKNGFAVGFSIVFAPAGESFCLLEYMAVDSGHRNSGFGGKLFQRTMEESVSRQGVPLPMLLEVDSDREASADREMRERRLQFYKKLGCLRVENLSYILPLPGKDPVPEMFLLVCAPAIVSGIRKPQLEHWLGVIYQTVYNCAPGDPRIVRMLEGVPDPVKLA